MFTTKIGNYDELFKSAWAIRETVFANEGKTYDREDEFDKSAIHCVLFSDDKPIATARLVLKKDGYYITRVAVLKEYQGQKLGARVMRDLLDYATARGINEIHLHSQCHAQGFYEKLGFEAYGEVFDEEGIDHISMIWKNNA